MLNGSSAVTESQHVEDTGGDAETERLKSSQSDANPENVIQTDADNAGTIALGQASSSPRPHYSRRAVTIAVNLSFAINALLLASKAIAFALTFSYAVIAALIDSVLDLLSQFIICITERKVRDSKISDEYPVGKTRLEPVGILTVSVLMILLSVSVIRESLQALITASHVVEFSVISILLLTAVIFLKFCLWLYCRRFTRSPIAMALAQDHINDVGSNTIALIALVIASEFPKLSWLDPVGAIVISMWIIWSWYCTGRDEVDKLVGRQAPDDYLHELRVVCREHHPEATLDVLRGYHIGRNFLVEVEMIMDKSTTLEKSHDVCIELQQKLEEFDYVERSFVHCDYMHRGFDEHKQPTLT